MGSLHSRRRKGTSLEFLSKGHMRRPHAIPVMCKYHSSASSAWNPVHQQWQNTVFSPVPINLPGFCATSSFCHFKTQPSNLPLKHREPQNIPANKCQPLTVEIHPTSLNSKCLTVSTCDNLCVQCCFPSVCFYIQNSEKSMLPCSISLKTFKSSDWNPLRH